MKNYDIIIHSIYIIKSHLVRSANAMAIQPTIKQ